MMSRYAMRLVIGLPPAGGMLVGAYPVPELSAEVMERPRDRHARRALIDALVDQGTEIREARESAGIVARAGGRRIEVARATAVACGPGQLARSIRGTIYTAAGAWVPLPSAYIVWGWQRPQIVGGDLAHRYRLDPGQVVCGSRWVLVWAGLLAGPPVVLT